MMDQGERLRLWLACTIGVVICLVIPLIIGQLTDPSTNNWYQSLIQPPFSPPAWLFAPVWTALYVMIGISGGLLWHHYTNNPLAFKFFVIQLVLNFAWSFIFFSAGLIAWALLDLSLLWLFTLLTILYGFKASKTASLLLLPYFLWSSYAWLLNASLFYLN